MSGKMPGRVVHGPFLFVGELSHRVYLARGYRELPNGVVKALAPKVGVTDQVGRVVARLDELGLELRPVQTAKLSAGEGGAT